MIDKDTVSRITEAANIVEVVSEFVTLRRAGVNYKGLCPFHNEKTPSFVVSPAKGYCKCFSCGKGGNAVHFLMELEQMSYPEALKWLAAKYHIEVREKEATPEEIARQNKREGLFVLNSWARDYFHNTLTQHPDGKAVGLTYFRQRGFRDDIIKKFQLGFSLSDRSALSDTARKAGYTEEALVETGLSIKTDRGTLRDRYQGRVIFPVHTLSGKVVAFGGRILNSSEKAAKYVNSPESDIYHKSKELYGIYFAKQAIVRQNCCYLVEGYTDVISMHQSGVENVVASSGTALTEGQINMIHRFTDNITVLYDGDAAGIKASLRGINMLLADGLNVKVLLLPDGEDPDSFSRKHTAEEFTAYISQNQVDFIRFKANLLLAEAGNDPLKKAQLITDVVTSISVIPDAITRSMYIKECVSLLQVDELLLVEEVAKLIRTQREAKPQSAPPPHTEQDAQTAPPSADAATAEPSLPPSPPAATLSQSLTTARAAKEETLIIQQVVRHGEVIVGTYTDDSGQEVALTLIEYVHNSLAIDELRFHNELYNQVLSEGLAHLARPDFTSADFFLHHPDAAISRLALDLVAEKYNLSTYHSKTKPIASERDTAPLTIQHLMLDFKHAIVSQQAKQLLMRINAPEIQQSDEQLNALLKEYQEVKAIQNELARQLGNRVVIR